MDIEISAEAKNKALNRRVAITVVLLSVFLGLAKIKDDNLVQAMQQAKADAVDTWGEYQAAKTKLHIAETAAGQLSLLQGLAGPSKTALAADQAHKLEGEIDKYHGEIPKLADKARGFEHLYDALNFHDDQFDMCDAMVAIAVSTAAVAALTESSAVLIVAWIFGALGTIMGLAGFLGWSLHPDLISRLLS
jgi:hypothetical protein